MVDTNANLLTMVCTLSVCTDVQIFGDGDPAVDLVFLGELRTTLDNIEHSLVDLSQHLNNLMSANSQPHTRRNESVSTNVFSTLKQATQTTKALSPERSPTQRTESESTTVFITSKESTRAMQTTENVVSEQDSTVIHTTERTTQDMLSYIPSRITIGLTSENPITTQSSISSSITQTTSSFLTNTETNTSDGTVSTQRMYTVTANESTYLNQSVTQNTHFSSAPLSRSTLSSDNIDLNSSTILPTSAHGASNTTIESMSFPYNMSILPVSSLLNKDNETITNFQLTTVILENITSSIVSNTTNNDEHVLVAPENDITRLEDSESQTTTSYLMSIITSILGSSTDPYPTTLNESLLLISGNRTFPEVEDLIGQITSLATTKITSNEYPLTTSLPLQTDPYFNSASVSEIESIEEITTEIRGITIHDESMHTGDTTSMYQVQVRNLTLLSEEPTPVQQTSMIVEDTTVYHTREEGAKTTSNTLNESVPTTTQQTNNELGTDIGVQTTYETFISQSTFLENNAEQLSTDETTVEFQTISKSHSSYVPEMRTNELQIQNENVSITTISELENTNQNTLTMTPIPIITHENISISPVTLSTSARQPPNTTSTPTTNPINFFSSTLSSENVRPDKYSSISTRVPKDNMHAGDNLRDLVRRSITENTDQEEEQVRVKREEKEWIISINSTIIGIRDLLMNPNTSKLRVGKTNKFEYNRDRLLLLLAESTNQSYNMKSIEVTDIVALVEEIENLVSLIIKAKDCIKKCLENIKSSHTGSILLIIAAMAVFSFVLVGLKFLFVRYCTRKRRFTLPVSKGRTKKSRARATTSVYLDDSTVIDSKSFVSHSAHRQHRDRTRTLSQAIALTTIKNS
ncbi:unnamed protein product [Meganyctiphanes norvegica]|uniref:Uncharacterized protein n=1 Tax=Meganyctiphanes norvegica TaxID=48144 RepID=A0AAV2QB54_MEGNR